MGRPYGQLIGNVVDLFQAKQGDKYLVVFRECVALAMAIASPTDSEPMLFGVSDEVLKA